MWELISSSNCFYMDLQYSDKGPLALDKPPTPVTASSLTYPPKPSGPSSRAFRQNIQSE